MMTHMEPRHWQCPPDPTVPGALQPWQPQELLQGLSLHPAAEERHREVVTSPLAGLLGKGTRRCQCNCGGSKTVSMALGEGLGVVGVRREFHTGVSVKGTKLIHRNNRITGLE